MNLRVLYSSAVSLSSGFSREVVGSVAPCARECAVVCGLRRSRVLFTEIDKVQLVSMSNNVLN